MNLILLIAVLMAFLMIGPGQAAYLLNGKPTTVGAYAYGTPPSPESPFDGDREQKFLSFTAGALMDAAGDNLGRSVGFPHNSRDTQEKWLFVDLGQPVILDSLAVRSRLDEWWCIHYFQVAFSADGAAFGNPRAHPGRGHDSYPHERGLAADCELPVNGLTARFLRFRFFIPAWNHVQLGEIDLVAHTPPGVEPVAEVDPARLEQIVRQHTETPMVDRFGQWTREEWPGKVHSEEELIQRHRADQARYAHVNPDLERYDRFGGDKTLGLKKAPADKFRVAKVDGRWWFLTPDGYPFVMTAVDGVNIFDGMNMNTVVHPDKPDIARPFAGVPGQDDATFADCWDEPQPGVWRFDYFRANLVRVYGRENHVDGFYRTAVNRLRDWGFNALGKWTWHWEGTDTPAILQRLGNPLPFILVVGYRPPEGVTLTQYYDIADPWDPHFQASVENTVRYFAGKYGTNPYYLGLTIMNEGWWHDGVTQQVLERGIRPLHAPSVR